MAAALRIDTLKFSKRLAEAGLPREAAEAVAEGLAEADLAEVATKSDIDEVKAGLAKLDAAVVGIEGDVGSLKGDVAALKVDMAAVKVELAANKVAIADLQADIYGRLWVMGLGIVGLTVALMKLLPG